jgi:hypothetical protein
VFLLAINDPFIIPEEELFGAHKAFLNATKQSKAQVAGRLVDNITADIGERLISCTQLAIIILLLPFKSLRKDSFSTFRVDTIVRLFSNIADKCNIDRVLRLLTTAEYAMLLFRIGALSMFCATRPQGHYCLFPEDPQDRMVGRYLLQMQLETYKYIQQSTNDGRTSEDIQDRKSEAPPGFVATAPAPTSSSAFPDLEVLNGGLWSNIQFTPQSDGISSTKMPSTEDDIPPDWLLNDGFPKNGILKFQFLPGPYLPVIRNFDMSVLNESGGRIPIVDVVSNPPAP